MPRELYVVYVDLFLVPKHINTCIRVVGRASQLLLITQCEHILQFSNLHFAILSTINTMQYECYKLIIKFNVISCKYPRPPTWGHCLPSNVSMFQRSNGLIWAVGNIKSNLKVHISQDPTHICYFLISANFPYNLVYLYKTASNGLNTLSNTAL